MRSRVCGSAAIAVGVCAALVATSCGSGAAPTASPEEPVTSPIDAGVAVPDAVRVLEPVRSAFQLSPDGTRVSFLVSEGNSSSLWIAATADMVAQPVMTSDGDPIAAYRWAYTSAHILYERGGRVYSLDLTSGATQDLVPLELTTASFHSVGPERPQHAVIGGDVLYLVDITTGEHTVAQQDAGFDGYYVDHSLRVQLAYRTDGTARVLFRTDRDGQWREIGGASSVVGFDDAASSVFVLADDALLSVDLSTGAITEVDDQVTTVLLHPRTGALQAVAVTGPEWHAQNDDIAASLRRIVLLLDSDFELLSRSLDDTYWLLSSGPRVRLFDRSTHEMTFVTY